MAGEERDGSAGQGPDPYEAFLQRLRPSHDRGVKLGLERVREALHRLGDPQRAYLTVQVAGTNGKGSTVAMGEAICREAGLVTGLFTSPHLCRFTERIRIAGVEVQGRHAAAAFAQVEATGVPLTYFESATLIALVCMKNAGVEVAFLETGLGGRLDAVTAVDPDLTAITSIGLDHTELLGPDVASIAAEKAAIARPGRPLVLGGLPPAALDVVRARAAEVGAELVETQAGRAGDAPAPALQGAHQIVNARVAIALAERVGRALSRPISSSHVERGLMSVRWPGRMEWLRFEGVPVLLDCAHNEEAACALAQALRAMPVKRRPRRLVLSMVKEKDPGPVVRALAPVVPHALITRSLNPRSLPPAALEAICREAGFASVVAVEDPGAALRRAAAAGSVLVTGSLFLVGQVRALITGEPMDPIRLDDPLGGKAV